MQNKFLENKTALVTGGTRGIGYAIASAFLREGARVAILGTTAEKAIAAALRLAQENQVSIEQVTGFGTDVRDTAATATTIDSVVALFGGKLDILVNNAGITRDNLVMRLGEEDWDAVLDTNLKGVFNCIRAAVRPMMKARGGRIINISSVVGRMGNPGQANYAAAKAGVLGLTKTVARELATRNILVNAIAPGFVETDMTAALTPVHRQKLLEQIPLGRIATPQEIAEVALFLAGPAANYMTGQCLSVDGG
ncbi:MAG: 3-oxoacyl-[acyl-carrier-protein] reductase, partial [Victivallales bacterium]|nr:3-oxoacyl-[acyl-carrier-protein] reductase [Victivallales bacterium]